MFLITCIYVNDVEVWLQEHGFKYIFNIFSMIDNPIFRFHAISSQQESMLEQLDNMLADQKSRSILSAIIDHRKKKICDYTDIYETKQYFPVDVWNLTDHEVFVDAGAFVGDTIEVIKSETQDKFDRIYSFEADKGNFDKLFEKAKTDPRICCYPYAVWNKTEVLKFSADGASGFTTEDGEVFAEARSLDDVIKERVTFIKMDVEGAELKALQGAHRLITTYKPKLAICIYHKADDLWTIPFYIRSLVPEYKFYIRHHHKAWFETVLYAQL